MFCSGGPAAVPSETIQVVVSTAVHAIIDFILIIVFIFFKILYKSTNSIFLTPKINKKNKLER